MLKLSALLFIALLTPNQSWGIGLKFDQDRILHQLNNQFMARHPEMAKSIRAVFPNQSSFFKVIEPEPLLKPNPPMLSKIITTYAIGK